VIAEHAFSCAWPRFSDQAARSLIGHERPVSGTDEFAIVRNRPEAVVAARLIHHAFH